MGRPRKRHVQLELPKRDRNGQRRGLGRRKIRHRLGRPPNNPGSRSREKHGRREVFRSETPIHVVLRVSKEIGRLRKDKTYAALREALLVAARRESFRVVHVSIQAEHVHLIIEATDRVALWRGMQSFQISAAKRLNAAVTQPGAKRRRGSVFTDRYHASVITNPKQARHTLAYVLNNWRHHHEDREGLARSWKIDRYSSAISFDGWREPWASATVWRLPKDYLPLPVWPPRCWMLTDGWKRYGLVETTEVPGPKTLPEFSEY
jgi:REP element-mobilizing transposase RayT